MKRILMAAALALAAGGQALAADLPQPAPPPPRAPATYVPVPVPVFSWTGIYFGINGGYAFGSSNWSAPGVRLDRQLQHQRLPRRRHARRQLPVGPVRARHRGRWRLDEPQWHHATPIVVRVAKPRATGSPRCAAAPAMRLTASCSTGRAAPLSAISRLPVGAPALQQLDANRLDRRRRRRIRLHAELDRQGRIPLRRSRQPVLPGASLRAAAPLPPSLSPRTSSAPASTISSGNRSRVLSLRSDKATRGPSRPSCARSSRWLICAALFPFLI